MHQRSQSHLARWLAVVSTFVLVFTTSISSAADPAARQAELDAAFQAADAAKQTGPLDIPLLDQATLKLPKGFLFVPRPAADTLLKAMGNQVGDNLLGLIYGAGDDENWMAIARYEKSGYIKDDDAKNWNVDDLYNNLKQGTEDSNKDRASRGIPEIEITGWVEKPTYKAGPHQLVWSMGVKRKDAPDSSDNSVNYNTYVLGREGYISLNFIAGAKEIEAKKPVAGQLLTAMTFNPGKTYADFNAETDHTAEYGLAALVGGVAAKKLGFFALIAAFAAKWFKLLVVAFVAIGAGIRKYLGGKNKDAAERIDQ